jgi:1-acyl-sn-glycerol-3-phosphate acyltransferase
MIVKNVLKVLFRVQIINGDQIPLHGRAIICSNHVSAFDGPLIVAFTGRDVNFAAKKEAWDNKLFAHVLGMFNAIKVDRNRPLIATLREMKNILEEGKLLGIFPEGTRNGVAKGIDAKDGASFLSLVTKTPIIPTKIVGNYHLFHKVKVIYGNPFIVADKSEGTKQIMNAIDEIKVPDKSMVYKKWAKL